MRWGWNLDRALLEISSSYVMCVGPVVEPPVGNRGRRPLLVEFRETSQTFAKVVTERERRVGNLTRSGRSSLAERLSNDQKGILR